MKRSDKSRRCKHHQMGLLGGVLIGALLAFVMPTVVRRLDLNRVSQAFHDLFAPYLGRLYEGAWFTTVRQQAVDMLELETGDQVLEVSVGAGANLPYIAAKIGASGRIYGLDISQGMLAQAHPKLADLPCPVELRWGLAEELPYPDNSFDAVLHLGGIGLFSDRRRALEEMARVAKPGARIVVADEGVAPSKGWQAVAAKMLLALVPRWRPPLELVPDFDPELRYLSAGAFHFYAIAWRKAE